MKELRLAQATTCVQANAVLERLLPEHNGRFGCAPGDASDAHRALDGAFRLETILSVQTSRVVGNDYTIRLRNRHFQLLKPIYPGERRGQVVIEERLDGTMAIRFREHYLRYKEIDIAVRADPAAKAMREANPAVLLVGEEQAEPDAQELSGSSGMQPTVGRSGRTPAEPYPPDGESSDTANWSRGPAENDLFRKYRKFTIVKR